MEVEGDRRNGRWVGVLAGRCGQLGCHAGGGRRSAFDSALPGSSIVLVLGSGSIFYRGQRWKGENEHEHDNEHDWGTPKPPPPPPVAFLPFRQMDSEQCDVRWGDPADPARLPKGGRSDLGEFLPGFKTQASDIFIIEPVGNILGF